MRFWTDRCIPAFLGLAVNAASCALLASSLLTAGALAQASTLYTVTSQDDGALAGEDCTRGGAPCTLRSAVALARGGDTVAFAPSVSTIILQREIVLSASGTTDPIVIDGAGSVTISGGDTTRVFRSEANTQTTLRGLVIRDADVRGLGDKRGGAVHNSGTLRIEQCSFDGNAAASNGGSAVFNNVGTVTIEDSTLTNGVGSALYNALGGQMVVTRSTFSANKAAWGGGIMNQGSLRVSASLFSGNIASSPSTLGDLGSGGALMNLGAGPEVVATIEDSVLRDNFGSFGGAACNAGGTLTIVRTTISGNSADQGGGLCAIGGDLNVRDSTLNANAAGSNGGAIYLSENARLTLLRSTLTQNTAKEFPLRPDNFGNGAAVDSRAGTSVIEDSTIAANGGGGNSLAGGLKVNVRRTVIAGDTCRGAVVDAGGNLESGATCGLSLPLSKPGATLPLGPLQDNGGPTHTLLPQAGNEAIDFAACPSPAGVDQRSVSRPQGPRCDSGAVEVRSTGASFVLNVTVHGDGSVNSVPAGISACRAGAGDCSETYTGEGTASTIVLTASPAAGHRVQWSGACVAGADANQANVVMDGAKNCTASFLPATYPIAALVAASSPAGAGSFTCHPAEVTHGATSVCTATPAAGFAFAGATGCDTLSGTECTLSNVQTARTVVAQFVANSFSGTTVPASGPGGPATARFVGGGPRCRFNAAATGFVAAPAVAPPGQTLPQGMFAFELTGCDTTAVTMTVTWPEPVQDYIKHGMESVSAAHASYFVPSDLVVNGREVSFSVRDGALGDDDWSENGTIRDPTGPMQSLAEIPTLSGAGLLATACLAGLLGLRYRRKATDKRRG